MSCIKIQFRWHIRVALCCLCRLRLCANGYNNTPKSFYCELASFLECEALNGVAVWYFVIFSCGVSCALALWENLFSLVETNWIVWCCWMWWEITALGSTDWFFRSVFVFLIERGDLIRQMITAVWSLWLVRQGFSWLCWLWGSRGSLKLLRQFLISFGWY
jgi:hypothetical protein